MFFSGALDQTCTYYEEGTPVCFSRVSSLSSLHSSETRRDKAKSANSSISPQDKNANDSTERADEEQIEKVKKQYVKM